MEKEEDVCEHRKPHLNPLEITNLANQSLRINKGKSVAFLYITNDLSEKEIKKIIPLTIALEKRKYKGINLT